jgi:hypothetical protein
MALVAVVSLVSSLLLSRFIVVEGLTRDARFCEQLVANSILQRNAAGYFADPRQSHEESAEIERFLMDLLW